MNQKIGTHTIRRGLWRSVPTTEGIGFRTEATGEIETCVIEVSVDVEQLVNLIGWRAASAKTGETELQMGAVTLTVINRRIDK